MPYIVLRMRQRVPLSAVSMKVLLVGAACAAALSSGPATTATRSPQAEAKGVQSSTVAPPRYSSLKYDSDYPVIDYSRRALRNDIARLQERIDRGEVKLEFHPGRGYLDSLLEALKIDPSSQVLVYSKTSLQIAGIRAATPRAIYFNDDSYVAWVQSSDLLEISVMDADLGAVFYTMHNRRDEPPKMERELNRCLSCHDTFSMTGGGVPRFLLVSAIVGTDGVLLANATSQETTDRTPLRDRWGGWYVTGRHGDQVHLGNMHIQGTREIVNLERVRRGNLDTLQGLFDTRPYITDKSDIVALLVLEHQLYVKNLITRLNFKARQFMANEAAARPDGQVSWQEASPKTQEAVRSMAEQLIEAMLFVDAAGFSSKIEGSSGYDAWFQSLGPRDRLGRSLRALDLESRLFKYPLSYVVYSEGFDALPDYALDYIYTRFAEILSGRDRSPRFAHLSAADRRACLEILAATKPQFARYARLGDSG